MVWCKLRIFPTSKYTAQKIKFSIKDFFSKCNQIRSKLRIYYRNPSRNTFFVQWYVFEVNNENTSLVY